jgi:hypothetical protein
MTTPTTSPDARLREPEERTRALREKAAIAGEVLRGKTNLVGGNQEVIDAIWSAASLLDQCAAALRTERQANEELRAEVFRRDLALQDLTPGGSEFVNDPERCSGYAPAFPVWTELVCRVCGSTVAGRFTRSTVNRRDMKAEALAAGWALTEDRREWFCNVHRPDDTPPARGGRDG